MVFIGKNKQFKVIWNYGKQNYTVYKSGKYVTTKYCHRDIKSYLD